MKKPDIIDKGGRRQGVDRRQASMPLKGPDLRSNKERRTGKDRRKTRF